jgi:HEAT repeat protein
MSGSDEIAEEAGRLAKQRAFNASHFLAVLDRGDYVDVDPQTVPAAERDLVVPALRAMVSARSGVVRVNAGSALLKFGDSLGCATLVEALQAPELEIRRRALDRLIGSGIGNRTRSYSLAIDADAVLTALEPSVAEADARTRERALMVMGYLATPRAFHRLVELLADDRDDVRAEAAIALGRSGQDRGAVFVIEDMLARPDDPKRPKHYHLLVGLEDLCERGDPETRVRAAAVAIRFVRRNLTGGHEVANHGWNCLKAIRKAQLPEEVDLLRDVIASKAAWWVRGEALKRLAQLEGPHGIPRLLSALSDPDLRDAALDGLGALVDGAVDPMVIDTLAQEIAREGAKNISAVVRTFLACGGQAKGLAADIQARLDSKTAMVVHWLLNDIGPREVIAKLRPACGDKEISEAAIEKLEEKWRTDFNGELFVWNILSEPPNCLAGIVCKTVTSPAEHERLVEDLAKITNGRFAVEDVAQTVEPNGEELRLLLVHRGKGYSFSIQHEGRWLNLSGVLRGLNGILEGLGMPERFIELGEGGYECAVVTFVHAEKFLAAAQELHIQLAKPA